MIVSCVYREFVYIYCIDLYMYRVMYVVAIYFTYITFIYLTHYTLYRPLVK